MLSDGSIRLFSVEVIFARMYEGQPGLVEVLSFAEQAGYRLVGFYEISYLRNLLFYMNARFEHGVG